MQASNSVTRYAGHGKRTGGLQQHSIGDVYPYIVYGHQSNPDSPVRYGVMHADGSYDEGACYATPYGAYCGALALKQTDDAIASIKPEDYADHGCTVEEVEEIAALEADAADPLLTVVPGSAGPFGPSMDYDKAGHAERKEAQRLEGILRQQRGVRDAQAHRWIANVLGIARHGVARNNSFSGE